MQYFYENRHFKNQASVALNPLVSLFGHFITYSPRIVIDRQTDTHTQTKYRNPRSASVRRGLITQRDGPVSCTVCTEGGQTWKRHLDHIKVLKDHG